VRLFKGSRAAVRIGITLIGIYAVWIWAWRKDPWVCLAGGGVMEAAGALFATAFLFIAYRQTRRKYWLYYGCGAMCYFAAQSYWTTGFLLNGATSPAFGPDEILWSLQYFCYVAALYFQNRRGRNPALPFLLDILLLTTVSMTLYWQLFLGPALETPHLGRLMTAFNLFCASVNLVLLMSLLFLFMSDRSRVSRSTAYWLSACFLLKTAGSSLSWGLNEYVVSHGWWELLPDVCWFLSLLCLGFSAVYGDHSGIGKTSSPSKYPELKRYMPVALGGLLMTAFVVGTFPASPGEFGTMLGVGLLIARLFLGIRESETVNRALRQSNVNYRNWVDNALVGVFIEQDGKLVYVNRHCEEIFGYSAGEMLGSALLGHLAFEEISRFIAEADKLRQHIPTARFGISGVKYDKTPIELEMQLAMTFYEGKEALSGTLIDITERKLSEQWLIRSEKLSVVGQLAAGVAHEIRNPLTALKGFTQLLHQNNDDNRQYYEIMLAELERINYIVGEFMVLSKPHKRQELKEQNIHNILKSIVPILESEAILHNVIIRINSKPRLPLVRCDENQIKQVLINLMKNAIEAMPGGGTVTVRYGMDETKRALIVYIEDEGVGIPPDLLERLGEPFLTTKEKGTGLGIMVCYKIIEAHEGVLSISSKPGQGTVVKIVLPAR
jgi:two-component system sporulation sensor kinase A